MTNTSNSHILVTGGAGLIGSHLCDSLVHQGYHVTCADNFLTGRKENIKHLLDNPNFTLIEADVSQAPNSYLNSQSSYSYIFHLASPASPKGYLENPIKTYQVNSFGTHYLVDYARTHNARLLYSSTSEAYGDPLQHPQPETYWGNVNPIGERACYDESKRFGEMVCTTAHREFDQDIRIIRIFNTYGPRNDPHDGRVIPNFIMQAIAGKPITVFGDGTQTRSFCFVSDLVKGIEAVMFSSETKGEVINLGNPEEFSMHEAAKIIKKLAQSKSEIVLVPNNRQDDPNQRCPDINKAKKLLNWQPTISLKEGLVPTIEYFRKLSSS
jgi:nucleoside-diphosphate-sugar epimerase